MSPDRQNRHVIRLALIGCGAVAELCHLPGAARTSDVAIVALVDRNMSRARQLAARAGIEVCVADYREIGIPVDGVINALPHHLHAPVAIDFLDRSVPVLVEKPMARSLVEAEAMVAASRRSGAALQVALMNRFCDGARIVRDAVQSGWLGDIEAVDVEWGFVYDWPVASGFFFDRDQAGGGVLIDLGSHVIDLLYWWFGPASMLEYSDDGEGGVEAECVLSTSLTTSAGEVPATVTLSRLRSLRNTARITGSRFTIECDITGPTAARMWPTGRTTTPSFVLDSLSTPAQTLEDAYAAQLEAFAGSIRTGDRPEVSGEAILPSVALIDRCYRERRPLAMAWEL